MSRPMYDPDRIGDILKMQTYKKVVDDYDAAKEVIRKKKLAYGEPCAVPYKFRNNVMIAIGIGTPDINNPFIATNLIVEDSTGFDSNIMVDEDNVKSSAWISYDGDESDVGGETIWNEYDGQN